MRKKLILLASVLFCGVTGLASADQGPFVAASLKLAPGLRIVFQNRPVAQRVVYAPVQRVVVCEPRYVKRYPKRVVMVRDRGHYGYRDRYRGNYCR
jgi:hypothetical protein